MSEITKADKLKYEEIFRKVNRNETPSPEELRFIETYTSRLETKLANADILAIVIDGQIARGSLGSRSAIADARLDYGIPHNYPFLSENQIERYKKRSK